MMPAPGIDHRSFAFKPIPMRAFLSLSALLCVACAMAQSGAILVYFNQDTDPSVANGPLAVSLHQATDDTIEAYIDRAQSTIDVAVYNANDYSIMYALNDAKDRGVQVRYITEGSQSNTALPLLDPAIPVLQRQNATGSGMHNKFMSIDADDPERAWVMSGSMNWTQNGLFDDYNNLIFIQDQALALAYRTEFEEMWGGSGAQPNTANSKFGPAKTDNTPHDFTIGGVQVGSYFSPTDNTESHIISAINSAQTNVYAAMYAFTSTGIGSALLARDQQPGCTVRMDLEDAIYPGDEGYYLASNGVDVATHATDQVLLHHKYGIVDEGTTSDPLVITGSHNWTYSANHDNDENTLIIHDATIANLFYQEWHARRNDVAGIRVNAGDQDMAVWPNPADEEIDLRLPSTMGSAVIMLNDVAGRTVATFDRPGVLRTLDVGALPAGPYVLVCSAGAARAVRLVTIQR